MPKGSPITREFGENLAVQALAFLAQDPERLGVFLGLTGIGPDGIRKAAADPAFLAGVLDHVATDERLLRAVIGRVPQAFPRKLRIVSMNLPTEIGFDR